MLLTMPYDRERALTYARTWATARNPLFINFTGQGGDCTNFASQVLLAGSCVMNFTPDFGWYYRSINDRAPAWTGVPFFYDFLTQAPAFLAANGGVGPYGREVPPEELFVGDFIQLADMTGNYYHTLVVTGFEAGEVLVSAHSNDALDRRLSGYSYAARRCIHIEGVAVEVSIPDCFEGLLTGQSILPAEDAPGEEEPVPPDLPGEGDVAVPVVAPSDQSVTP